MSNSWLIDESTRLARFALDGLSYRQQAISRNLANVDTPGYQAATVNFKDAIQAALKNDGSIRMARTDGAHLLPQEQTRRMEIEMRPGGSLREDGNNVDIDVEMADMSEVGIEYQALTQLISKKFLLLRNIAQSR